MRYLVATELALLAPVAVAILFGVVFIVVDCFVRFFMGPDA